MGKLQGVSTPSYVENIKEVTDTQKYISLTRDCAAEDDFVCYAPSLDERICGMKTNYDLQFYKSGNSVITFSISN